jgi:hypothetical protein
MSLKLRLRHQRQNIFQTCNRHREAQPPQLHLNQALPSLNLNLDLQLQDHFLAVSHSTIAPHRLRRRMNGSVISPQSTFS